MAGTTFDPITSAQVQAVDAKVQAVDAKVQAVQTAVANISKGIKSVQRGTTTSSGAANMTISTVNPSKTFVNMNSVRVGGDPVGVTAYVQLTSPTNLLVAGVFPDGYPITVFWEVVEWY